MPPPALLDLEHLGADGLGILDGPHRLNDVSDGINGEHRHHVALRQQADALGRPQVGQIHLGFAPSDGHGHASRTIEGDGNGHAVLAVLVPQLHRNRQKRIERALEVTANAEAAFAAGQQETASQVLDELGQVLHPHAAERRRRHVLDDDGPVPVQYVGRQGRLAGRLEIDGNMGRLQRSPQRPLFSIVIDDQHPRAGVHKDDARSHVVFCERIARHVDLDFVGLHAALFQEVAKREPVATREEVRLPPRDQLRAAEHANLPVSLAVGIDVDRELERLAGSDRIGELDRFDRHVAQARSLEGPIVDRHAFFAGSPGRRQRIGPVGFAVREDQEAGRTIFVDQVERRRNGVGQIAAIGQDLLGEGAQRRVVGKRVLDLGLATERDHGHAVARFAIAFQIVNQGQHAVLGGGRHRAGAIGHDDDVDPFAAHVDPRTGQRGHKHDQERNPQPGSDASRPVEPREGNSRGNRQQQHLGVLEPDHGTTRRARACRSRTNQSANRATRMTAIPAAISQENGSSSR